MPSILYHHQVQTEHHYNPVKHYPTYTRVKPGVHAMICHIWFCYIWQVAPCTPVFFVLYATYFKSHATFLKKSTVLLHFVSHMIFVYLSPVYTLWFVIYYKIIWYFCFTVYTLQKSHNTYLLMFKYTKIICDFFEIEQCSISKKSHAT